MKWTFGVILVAAASMAHLSFGTQSESRVESAGSEGDYFAMVQSMDRSKAPGIIQFHTNHPCSACQQLESDATTLRRALSDCVTIRHHYLAVPATAPRAKIFYGMAAQGGKCEEVASDLPVAKLKNREVKVNVPVFQAAAKRHSSGLAFKKSRADGSAPASIRARWNASTGKVTSFPFAMFDDIATGARFENPIATLGNLPTPSKRKSD